MDYWSIENNRRPEKEASWTSINVAFCFSQLQYPEDDEDGQSEEGDGSNSPKPFERYILEDRVLHKSILLPTIRKMFIGGLSWQTTPGMCSSRLDAAKATQILICDEFGQTRVDWDSWTLSNAIQRTIQSRKHLHRRESEAGGLE